MMRRLGITSNSSSAASLSEAGWASWLLARRWTVLKVLLAVILLVWPVFSGNMYYVSVMTNAGLYMILTVAVGLITGQAGQLSFGHAAFYAMGAYVSGLLVVKLGVPTLAAWIVGAVAAGLVALIIGRPVLKLRYFYLALATIGLVMIVVALVSTLTSLTGGLSGFYGVSPLNIAGFEIDTFLRKYYLVWIVALVILLFTDRLLKYRVGRTLRAIATSETASSTLGMRNSNWKLRTFVVSAVLCGIAGGLYVFVNSMATPAVFNFNASILPMVMMLLGGSSLWTGVLGAILMTWVVQGLGGVQQYSGLVYAVILLLLLLFLPEGITGGLRPEHRKRLLSLFRRKPSTDASECLVPPEEESFVQGPAVAQRGAAADASTELQAVGAEARGKAAVVGEELLRVENLTVKFGGLTAVDDVSLSVNEGEIVALIGPNGAGKTTLFNAMSRLQRSDGGRLWFRGSETTKLNAADVARLGQARTFQNLRLFTNMSVLENVLVGCHRHEKSGFWAGGTGLFGQRREEKASRERALAALAVVGLEEEAHRPAVSLPAGRQRLVEIARALASKPDLLMLDEPACGMNSAERIDLVDKIRKIRESGVTVLLVEHDVAMVMGLCDRVYVLDFGRLIACGVPEEVRKNPAVLEAYLGVEEGEKTSARSEQPREEAPVSESVDSLVVEDLTTCYGSIKAIQHVSLTVGATEVVAVVGSNGAGKTTLLHTISGLLTPTAGSITYRGTDLLRTSPEKIPALGLCQVPAGRQLFPSLSVEDNLLVGSSCRADWRKALKDQIAYVYELFPILGERRLQLAGRLSGGEQQMLAIGRALIGSPTMLLLDETSMGLAPLVTERIFEAVKKLNKGGMAILMVEQNVALALSIADRVVVLRTGAVAFTGDADAFRDNDQMRRAYLGEDPAESRGLQS